MSGIPPIPPIVGDEFPESQRYPTQEYYPEPQQPDSTTTFMTDDHIVISWMAFDQIFV